MKLLDKLTGLELEASVKTISEEDFETIKRDKGFGFNWETENGLEVLGISLISSPQEFLGLVSLIDFPKELRVHINLLEVTKEQQGADKTIDYIAGCLIAAAAERAIKRGYFGFVSLEPKTLLKPHYINKYGFRPFGKFLALEGGAAIQLVEKFMGHG